MKGGRLLLLCLGILCQAIGVTCEGQNEETQFVSGAEGGNVTLQLRREDVVDVSWIYDGHVRITTKPGEPIQFIDPDHKGNMEAMEDASIVITNLSLEDQKVYSASLQLKEIQENQIIHYDLKVYKTLSAEDIHFERNITSAEPCNVFIACVVKNPNVTVTWTDGGAPNITSNVRYIEDARPSLSIACMAQNPVSNVTKTVKPSEFCRGKKDEDERRPRTWIIVGIVLAVIVVIIVAGFGYRKVKKGKNKEVRHLWELQSSKMAAAQEQSGLQKLQIHNPRMSMGET